MPDVNTPNVKPVSISVRPFRVSNLCFPVGGILEEAYRELGDKVIACNFFQFYQDIRTIEISDDGRLLDAVSIELRADSLFLPLAKLRAEPQKAALTKALAQRANAFITKYKNVTEIANFVRAVKPANGAQLAIVSDTSTSMRDQLDTAYKSHQKLDKDGHPVLDENQQPIHPFVGVVKTTTTDLTSHLNTEGTQDQTATETQTIVNTGNEFRMPRFEELMRDERLQASLGDERIATFMQILALRRMEDVYRNELAAIDADVNQLQIAYADTILLSPIAGIVTGVYKNPGDPVSAGEPVFRVEDNSAILIVANIVFRGPIAIGAKFLVTTKVFDLPGSSVELEASVVSARGQRDNDHWEVIAKCSNLNAAGKTIFPLGYHFDYDNTTVSIS